ncbi:MAG: histidinol phosphatase [Actinomycetota bacterium]|nr:histidinol phosphatase [Actinomycetota bacterium]
MPGYSTELAAAREFALLGGRIALRHYRKDPQRERKADGTWVTEADWAVEAQIRLRIARTFPDHNVLGEEEGLTAAGGGAPRADAPTWIIDPIDGTTNYIAGIPVWATLVGLQVGKRSVVGVCHAPALGETYQAAIGLGAQCNDEAISVDPQSRLEEATVIFGAAEAFKDHGLAAFFEDLIRAGGRSRGFGDFWGHMLVARGAAHVMVEPRLAVWDVAALEPIVSEAGGKLSRLDGSRWSPNSSCLTTNGALHDRVGALAREANGPASPYGKVTSQPPEG